MRDDPDAMHVVIHALNEWMYETWQFNFEGLDRIFATPVITLPIVEKAIEELEWVVERGARAILIRPAPVPGFRGPRSFALPEFDPFWEKVVEHDILVGPALFRQRLRPLHQRVERRQWRDAALPDGSLPDAAFVASGGRRCGVADLPWCAHPSSPLKVAVIENGSSWVGPLLTALKDLYKKRPQDFQDDPVQQLKDYIHISPFWEEDLSEVSDLIGEDRVLFGSDFPHPEGLAEPRSYMEALTGASPERVAKIMGGNLARLMNVNVTVPA